MTSVKDSLAIYQSLVYGNNQLVLQNNKKTVKNNSNATKQTKKDNDMKSEQQNINNDEILKLLLEKLNNQQRQINECMDKINKLELNAKSNKKMYMISLNLSHKILKRPSIEKLIKCGILDYRPEEYEIRERYQHISAIKCINNIKLTLLNGFINKYIYNYNHKLIYKIDPNIISTIKLYHTNIIGSKLSQTLNEKLNHRIIPQIFYQKTGIKMNMYQLEVYSKRNNQNKRIVSQHVTRKKKMDGRKKFYGYYVKYFQFRFLCYLGKPDWINWKALRKSIPENRFITEYCLAVCHQWISMDIIQLIIAYYPNIKKLRHNKLNQFIKSRPRVVELRHHREIVEHSYFGDLENFMLQKARSKQMVKRKLQRYFQRRRQYISREQLVESRIIFDHDHHSFKHFKTQWLIIDNKYQFRAKPMKYKQSYKLSLSVYDIQFIKNKIFNGYLLENRIKNFFIPKDVTALIWIYTDLNHYNFNAYWRRINASLHSSKNKTRNLVEFKRILEPAKQYFKDAIIFLQKNLKFKQWNK